MKKNKITHISEARTKRHPDESSAVFEVLSDGSVFTRLKAGRTKHARNLLLKALERTKDEITRRSQPDKE